ncbi:hypothetical protein Tco_0483682 [Tanacetum coccineum]
MANKNVLAPTPTRFDDQILPFAAWVPIGKSNFVLDLQKKQRNPIFQISIDILQNTNFFRAFPASTSVPTIYIQQFWNILTYEAKTGAYSFQLDENRFILDANLLRESLEITPIDQVRQFVSPPPGDAIMDFEKPLEPSPAKQSKRGKVRNIRKGKSPLKLIDEDKEVHHKLGPQGEGEEYDVERAIQMSLELFQAHGQALVGGVDFRETVASGITKKLPIVEGKGKGIATDEQVAQSLLELQTPKKTNAETGAETDKTNSEGDTEILNIVEEQGEDVANPMNLEEKTGEVDEDQAGSDPGKTLESRPPPECVLTEEDQARPNLGQSHVALARPNPEPMHEDFVSTVYPQVHESLKHTDKEHVHLENPLSSTRTLSSMKNLNNFNFSDQFFNFSDTSNMDTKVKSMVTVLIHQASSSVLPLSTPVIDLTPPKPVSPTIQAPIFTATKATTTTTLPLLPLPQQSSSDPDLASHVSALKQVCANFEKRLKLQDKTVQVQALLKERFRDLSEADMKEILHDRMFESGSYRSQPEHVALYEALEASMERENQDDFLAENDKSRKRCWDDQDPPPPPTKESEQKAPSSSSKQKTIPHFEQPVDEVPIPDDVNISYSEDTDTAHLPKIKTRVDWLEPVPEEDRPETPEPDWVIPPNDLPEPENNWANAFANSYQDPKENKLLQKTSDISLFIKWYCRQIGKSKLNKANLEGSTYKEYDISVAYDITHWWFKRKEFYITRHSAPSYRGVVRSHMRILNVISLKTYERYGYTFLKEIVLRRADYKEYKISEADFKNLHPNDFEDPEDYTIVNKLRAVIYKGRNDQKKMMRETEVHKFSDGTLTRILEKLDHMVKDFKLFKYNPCMESRIWSEDDCRRSKDFMEVIKRRLKIRRIFRSLESFISGRLRDVDYRLISRTE